VKHPTRSGWIGDFPSIYSLEQGIVHLKKGSTRPNIKTLMSDQELLYRFGGD